MGKEPQSATDTVESLEHLAEDKDEVRLADVLDEFGKRSFGPFMFIPAILEVSPIGGIPGVPTVLAAFIAMIALQLLFGRDHVWIPQFAEKRALKSDKLMKSAKKLEGFAEKLDHWFKGRLKQFTGPTWQKISAIAIILLCITVPPLEFIPFASSAPMLTIAAFALALTVRDGLLTLISCILSVVAIGVGTYLYYTSDGSGGGSFLPF